MLDAVSTGFHPSAIMSQISEKYGVSERALWSDWERRSAWVPLVLGLEGFAGFCDEIRERLNAVQKAAWSIYLKASNDSARVGALRTVLEALEVHGEIVQTAEVIERRAHATERAENTTDILPPRFPW